MGRGLCVGRSRVSREAWVSDSATSGWMEMAWAWDIWHLVRFGVIRCEVSGVRLVVCNRGDGPGFRIDAVGHIPPIFVDENATAFHCPPSLAHVRTPR
jgi:hypothetical protein